MQRKAFTLVELMVVVVILGIMATVVTVSVTDYLLTGKQNAARSEVAQIKNALELYFTEHGRLRAAAIQLEALINVLRTEAMTSGHAVVLRYTRNQGTIAVLRPTVRGDEIVWVRTPGVELPGAVRVTHVASGDDEATDPAPATTWRAVSGTSIPPSPSARTPCLH